MSWLPSSGPRFLVQTNARRVVVTGLGVVTPLVDIPNNEQSRDISTKFLPISEGKRRSNSNVSQTWNSLLRSQSGITPLPDQLRRHGSPVSIGGVVRGKFDEWDACGRTKSETHDQHILRTLPQSRTPRSIAFALEATREALDDTGNLSIDPERIGVSIGSCFSGLQGLLYAAQTLDQSPRGYRKITPFLIPNSLVNMAAGRVAIEHDLRGPILAPSTACATGAHAIGDAFRLVSLGDADVMVCGGTEACLDPIIIAGFSRAGALCRTSEENAAEASRPFDKNRSGFVASEGSGILVLEELEHAKNRGAHIYCELRGYGFAGDAYHITSASPDGKAAARSLEMCLHQATIKPSDVQYMNAHATSTVLGDEIENHVVKNVFASHAECHDRFAISSTKGATGHLLGAAGAVESIFTIKSITDNLVPPTLNLHEVSKGFDLNYVPLIPQRRNVDVAVTTSFGFGGVNAALCYSKCPL
eukprot:UC4_evm1s804